MNRTILCWCDWGQITLSYALLPFRPSSATVSPSVFLIAPEKNGHFKLFVSGALGCGLCCVGFRASCAGYPLKQSHPASRWLRLLGRRLTAPQTGGLGPVLALGDRRKILHRGHLSP
jgi:hypothetical protein